NGAARRIDVTNLSFPDFHFDLILCNHVLEHVPDDRRAMSELRRVLKKNGRAILQVPISLSAAATDEAPSITSPAIRERRFGQFAHVRLYARHDYLERLRASGFSVSLHQVGLEPSHGCENRYGIIEGEELFIATRGVD